MVLLKNILSKINKAQTDQLQSYGTCNSNKYTTDPTSTCIKFDKTLDMIKYKKCTYNCFYYILTLNVSSFFFLQILDLPF